MIRRLLATIRGLTGLTVLGLGALLLWTLVDDLLGVFVEGLSRHGVSALLALPFEQGLVVMAAGLLLCCSAWLLWASAVLVVQTLWWVWRATPDKETRPSPISLPGPARPDRASSMYPRWLQRIVVLLCGAGLGTSLTVTPAVADAPDVVPPATRLPASLDGLTLPDRTVDGPPRTFTVAPGDTLWAIAQRTLPTGSSTASITGAWQRIYRRNADRVGPDPDLLIPGTSLSLPNLASPHRKERP